MNGSSLAIGVVAGLAVAGALTGRRGSASVVAVLPQPSEPTPGKKPSWASSWSKGKAWAREQLEKYPTTHTGNALDALDEEDRKVIEQNTMMCSSLEQIERRLRLSLSSRVRPKVLAEAQRIDQVASRKLAYGIPTHERAFWEGVRAYMAQVADMATNEEGAARAEALMDDVEAEMVKAWLRRRREGSRALDFDFFDMDDTEVELSPIDHAWRAFEASSGTLPEHIAAHDLFRSWPEGVDMRVGLVRKSQRGGNPGWFIFATEARTEADARRVGKRAQNALIAPRSLRADQPRLHDLPLTVGWSGSTVMLEAIR